MYKIQDLEIFVFFFLLLLFVIFLVDIGAEAETIEVSQNSECDDHCIQDAIDGASSGDIVYVHNGRYNESLKITFPLSIIGEDRDSVFIIPKEKTYGIMIESDFVFVANITLRIEGKRYSSLLTGIKITNNVTSIRNVNIDNFFRGIDIIGGNNNTIRSISISNVSSGVIIYSQGNDNEIANGTVNNCITGIRVTEMSKNTSIENLQVGYCSDRGIIIDKGSDYNTIFNCHLSECKTGVIILYSSNNKLENSTIQNNANNGVWIMISDNTLIANCTIEGNGDYGIYQQLGVRDNSVIKNNTYHDNAKGDLLTLQTKTSVWEDFFYLLLFITFSVILIIIYIASKKKNI